MIKNKKKLISLILILFLFNGFSMILLDFSFVDNIFRDLFNQEKPKPSNTIYINKPYTFELYDFYDSDDLYHKYTSAKYQVGNSTDSLISYSVDPFYENYETELGDPDDITVSVGTSDYADNMEVLDNSYTLWTSIAGSTTTTDLNPDVLIGQSGWSYATVDRILTIDDLCMASSTLGAYAVFSVNDFSLPMGTATGVQIWVYGLRTLTTGAIPGASYRIGTGSYSSVVQMPFATSYEWRSATYSGLSLSQADVNDLQFRITIEDAGTGGYPAIDRVLLRLTYTTVSPELSTEITMQFTDADVLDDKLSLKVSSTHRTNIANTIDFEIYNFDTSNWDNIHSGSATSFTERLFSTSSYSNYLNSTNHIKLKYSGTGANQFQLHVDYLWGELYAKLDLEYTKTFTEIGVYMYRWEITGSLYYTDYVLFEVVYPPPNFHAISESDITTRWILQESTLTPIEDFHDDINTNYWNLIDVSESFFQKPLSQSSNYLLDNSSLSGEFQYTGTHFDVGTEIYKPQGIEWDGAYFWVVAYYDGLVYKYTSAGVYAGSYFSVAGKVGSPFGIAWDGTYFWVSGVYDDYIYKFTTSGYAGSRFYVGGQDSSPQGVTWDGTYFWVVGDSSDEVYKYTSAGVYTDTHFDIGAQDIYSCGIEWDGAYFWVVGDNGNKVYKYTSAGVYTGIQFGAQDSKPHGVTWDGTYLWSTGDNTDEVYKYEPKYNISKNYFGSGYIYMQTDTTELISLKSKDYGSNYNLSSGDYFEVDFQTSSDSQINLILLKDGSVNKTLILSQSGNTNFDRHTTKISVGEFVEFDQLKISSTFEDKDYVKVYDIKSYKYEITGDYADFYVGSNNDYEIYLTPETYNLRIFEEGDEKLSEDVTIPATGVLDYVYTPIEKLECRLALFNIGKESSLNFVDYHVNVNRSLNGVYNDFSLLEPIFYADKETYVYIDVYDRFDTLIDSFERLASDYIDLELEVYQLQIKNLMTQKTVLNINNSLFVHPLLSGDSIYFTLSKAYYTIQYYDTNDVEKQFTIYLDSNQAYELNRSQICFLSYTDEQGNHLFFEDYKTYLNDTLIYEKVFYEEIGTDVHINITDRYGINIYIGTYTVLASDNYIPIILEVYELKLKNMQNEFNYINITRSPYPIVGTVGDIVESGHYLATYSFTDVPVGTSGIDIDWVDSIHTGTTTEIIALLDEHRKVLSYTETINYQETWHYFYSEQINGTIEFWVQVAQTNLRTMFEVCDGGISDKILLAFHEGGNIQYHDGSAFIDTGFTYSADTWYHFKIKFDCITDWHLWIDGVSIDGGAGYTLTGNPIAIDRILIRNFAGTVQYFDGIGYSWDTIYNLGDNLHDNYYLGSETFESYNQTVEGYYTGTESFDYNTEEGVYYGTYDFGDDNVSVSGDYYGTYSFEGDADGSNPAGWTIDENVEVISDLDGHKKVVNVSSQGTADYGSMINTFSSWQTSGVIEFWYRYDSNIDYNYIYVKDAGQTVINIRRPTASNEIKYYNSTDWLGIQILSENEWFHFRIDFDCGTDSASIYVNGLLKIDDEPFYNVASDLRSIYLGSYSTDDNVDSAYFDAFGYSWDGDYTVRDNINSYGRPSDVSEFVDEYFIQNDCEVSVVDSLNNHKKVFHVASIVGKTVYAKNLFSSGQTSGTMEFWTCTTDAVIGGCIYIIGDIATTSKLMIFIDVVNPTLLRICYGNGAGGYTTKNVAISGWAHVKTTFDCATDTFSCWVDGISEVTDVPFYNDHTVSAGDALWIANEGGNKDIYIDALGYSWDSISHNGLGYTIGYSINPYDIEPLLENDWYLVNFVFDTVILITSSLDGHNNILNMTDNTAGSRITIRNEFSDQVSGTLEWWWLITNASEECNLIMYHNNSWEFGVDIEGGKFRVYESNAWSDIGLAPQDNVWYHIRIDFECGSDGYQGLSADDWHLYINGTLYGDYGFKTDQDHLNNVYFHSETINSGYSFYVDALGYSWDSGYDVGDNINSHGHDVIDELEAGGYSFNSYVLNSIGISGEFNSHKKFINMTDGSSLKGDSVISNTFNEESGTIEFYFKHTTTTKISYFILRTPVWPDIIGTIRIDANGFIKWVGDVQTSLQSYSVDTWYHVRIDFECGSGGYMGLAPDTVDIYINGVLKGDDLNFDTPTTTFYQFYLSTHTTGFGYSVYFDAIACSWISGYYVGDNYNFYDVESEYSWTTNIAPEEIVSFRLLKGFYNIWMVNSEETISFSFRMFADNYFILNRSQMCFLSYINQRGEYLNFRNYNTTINGTIIYKHVFYENIGTIVNITVKDFYSTTLATQNYTVLFGDNYIPITLDIYELKIKNEATEIVDYTLLNVGTDVSRSGILFFDEIVEFSVALGDYSLDYINNEDMYPREYNFTLTDHKTISINSTYHTVYFSLFTYDGLGVDHDLVRFYINDQRKDFGFNVIQSETAHLIVLDFFNNTLANDTIDALAFTEWNIFVEIYSLIILNQFTYEDIVVNITQVGSGMWMTQIIPKQFGLTYRFLPDVEYNITIYFTNATFYDSRIVNLTSNSHIESFGVATIVPEYPKDVYFGIYTTTGLGVDHDLLRFYIEGNRSDFGFNRIEDMIVSLVVKDFFNTTLFNQLINTSGIYEYDILITLYSLKVKNEARIATNYTLKLGGLDTTGFILPDEIIEYQLATNNYVFDYTNNEDSSFHTISINLNQDRVYILNSTYYDVYFGLYNFYGIVNKEEVKFYINGTRADFGFNTIKSERVGLLVLDYFNSTLYNQIVRLEGLNEYSVFVQAYTLVVNNLYNTQSITISITRGSITIERLIEAQGWTEFKLFANTTYDITSYVDGVKDEEKEIELDEEYKTVDFGFYEEEISDIPDFNAPVIWLIIILILLGCGTAIVFIGYIANRYKKKSENYRRSYADKITLEAKTIKKFSQGTRVK